MCLAFFFKIKPQSRDLKKKKVLWRLAREPLAAYRWGKMEDWGGPGWREQSADIAPVLVSGRSREMVF